MNTTNTQKHTQHTPGPWYFRPEEPSVEAEHQNNTGFFCTVADCGKSRTLDPEEMQANARLIAAAPELLEALKQIADADYGTDTPKLLETARAALSRAQGKARGE